jgi:hypothetical protein
MTGPKTGSRSPRFRGELLMLGFDISERTVSRRDKRTPRFDEGQIPQLQNHFGEAQPTEPLSE